jgi:hypothetical protein
METKFSKEDIDGLGKFKVDNYREEIINLIGYLVLPAIRNDREIVVNYEDLIGIFVIYSNGEKPRLGFRDGTEDLVSRYYFNYNMLSMAEKAIIESDRNYVSKKDIDDFLLKALIDSIGYSKRRINQICKKWPHKEECLKVLGNIEDNIDQLYILKTDFYERS